MTCTFSHNPARRSCHFLPKSRLLMLGRNMSSQSYSMPFTLVTSLLLVRANLELASGGVKTRWGRNTDVRRPILVLCALPLSLPQPTGLGQMGPLPYVITQCPIHLCPPHIYTGHSFGRITLTQCALNPSNLLPRKKRGTRDRHLRWAVRPQRTISATEP